MALTEHLRVDVGMPVRLVSDGDLALPAVDAMLQQRYALVSHLYGWSHELAMNELQQLCTHMEATTNHLLAGKRTFWGFFVGPARQNSYGAPRRLGTLQEETTLPATDSPCGPNKRSCRGK